MKTIVPLRSNDLIGDETLDIGGNLSGEDKADIFNPPLIFYRTYPKLLLSYSWEGVSKVRIVARDGPDHP